MPMMSRFPVLIASIKVACAFVLVSIAAEMFCPSGGYVHAGVPGFATASGSNGFAVTALGTRADKESLSDKSSLKDQASLDNQASFRAIESRVGVSDGHAAVGRIEATPNQAPPSVKVTMIAVPGLSFLELHPQELARLPHLQSLIARSAVGAMNIRTGSQRLHDVYVSVGAGSPAVAGSAYGGWNSQERMPEGSTAGELWRRRMPAQLLKEQQGQAQVRNPGHETESAVSRPTDGTVPVVVPGIQAVLRMNERSLTRQALPGLLGQRLAEAGVRRYVFGNSDRHDEGPAQSRYRYAPLLLMDRGGMVDGGDIGSNTTVRRTEMPFSIGTNYGVMLRQWEAAARPSVVLLELGDLHRLYGERALYHPDVFLSKKREIMREIDRFIGHVAARLQTGDSLWLFSPEVNADAKADKWLLSPVLVYDPEIGQGRLTSPTTRRIGIVSHVDTAPTLLSRFRLEIPDQMPGMAVSARADDQAMEQVWREVRTIREIYAMRPPVLYTWVGAEIAVMLIAVLVIVRRKHNAIAPVRTMLFVVLASPLMLLWGGYAAVWPPVWLIGMLIVCMVAAGWGLSRLPAMTAWAGIGGLTALAILSDVLWGAPGMKHSVLGYDPMIGARYYGIGNEFMGVLLGSALLAGSVWAQRLKGPVALRTSAAAGKVDEEPDSPALSRVETAVRRRLTERLSHIGITLLFLWILFALASPALGANAGGAITATAAFGLAWTRFVLSSGRPVAPMRWSALAALLLACAAAALAALWLANAVVPAGAAASSHVGRAMTLVAEGRYADVAHIALRKLAMNWHLIRVSVWSKAFIASLAATAVVVLRPRGVFRDWQRRYPYLMHGFSAIAVGAVVALLVNDSGIVAAALMYIYAVVPMLLLKLQDMSDSHSA